MRPCSLEGVRRYQRRYHISDFSESNPERCRVGGGSDLTESRDSDEELARRDDERLIELQERIGRDWVESGQIILRSREGKLWRHLGFDSHKAWMKARTHRSYEYGLKAMGLVEDLESLGDRLDGVTMANAEVLAKLSPEMRTDEVVQQAHELPAREFELEMERTHPGVSDPEGTTPHTFRLPKSFEPVYEAVIEKAMKDCGTRKKGVALEMIFSHYLMCEHTRNGR